MSYQKYLRFPDLGEVEDTPEFDKSRLPKGWQAGKPFIFLSEGEIYDRTTGSKLGTCDESVLQSIVKGFSTGDVGIDLDIEHDPKKICGSILSVWETKTSSGKKALAALPALAPQGQEYMTNKSHTWPSPLVVFNDKGFKSSSTGELVGPARCLRIALTDTPRSPIENITSISLAETNFDNIVILAEEVNSLEKKMTPEEIQAEMAKRDERLAALESMLAELKDAVDKLAPQEDDKEEEKPKEDMALSEKVSTSTQYLELSEKVKALEKERNFAILQAAMVEGKVLPGQSDLAAWVLSEGGLDTFEKFYNKRLLPEGSRGVSAPSAQGGNKAKEKAHQLAEEKGLKVHEAYRITMAGKGK